ncbi:hypothetical protein CAPTEDRAFT_190629 [Capitella teleta]|uniref:G-protein coupled receptors family 1 profile domain-containing protein n=1 Tax=Capitella teleta TaxID=283909 RepID=R7U497_CAPTE|nr:hypothetical protein CAPTEDRAFT_190629 [Capitella teleta]|eukprot:ELU00794.1 hypothetical protein CAPTEDRAFT_190629 [Capitella teleta]
MTLKITVELPAMKELPLNVNATSQKQPQDRFVAVWLPFRATTICSVSKAKMVTLLLFITLVIYNVHVFCTIDLRSIDVNQRRQFCGARKNRYMREMFNYVNFATYSVIPFVIVLILNIGIIIKVSRSAPHINGELAIRSNDAAVEKQQRQQRVTYMLLTVSFTFILLTGPFTLHSLIVKDTKDVNQQARNLLSKTICFMLMYANHSVNFYLYCVTGKKFRNEFIDTFSVCFRDNRIVRRRSSNRTFRTPIGRCPSPNNDALALNIPPNRLPVEVVELEENLAVQ